MALDFGPNVLQPSSQDMLPTPENYATPQQLQSMQDYVKLLRSNSQQPVYHWSQGVSNIVNALMGGYLQEQMRHAQRATEMGAEAGHNTPAGGITPAGGAGGAGAPMSGAMPPMATYPGMPQPQGANNQNPTEGANSRDTAGPSASANPMAKEAAGISANESGGDYNALGPVIKQGPYAGDRAYGKYGIMGKNIPQWTQEVLGRAMPPDEFLHNANAQDQVFKAKFGQLEAKYGPEGASKAWFAGEGGMNQPGRKDQLGTTVADYGRKFMNVMGGPPGAQAAGGGPIQVAANGNTPIQMAAARTPGGAPQINAPYAAGGRQPILPPGLVPQRPQITEQQHAAFMTNDFVPDWRKQQFEQYYQAQHLPIAIPYTGGTLLVNPNDLTQQGYVPQVHWAEKTIGPIKRPMPIVPGIQPGGGVTFSAPSPYGGPQSMLQAPAPGGAGGAVPQNVGQGGPAVPAGGPALAAGTPAAPAPALAAAQPPQQAEKPVQVASLEGGPVTEGVQPKSPIPTAAPPAAPGAAPTQVAQATQERGPFPSPSQGFPGVPQGENPQDWAEYIATQKSDAAKAALQADMTAEGAAYTKKYDAMQSQGVNSARQLSMIEAAKKMVEDPATAQGLFAQPQLLYQRLVSAMGFGTPDTATSTQVFQKLVSNQILDNLRAFTQGASVGQIRTAEIALQKLSAPNIENTPQANMALLNILQRLHERNVQVADMASNYAVTHGHLDAGFDRELLKFEKANPVLKAEDYNFMDKLGNEAEKQAKGNPVAPGGAQGGPVKINGKAAFDKLAPGTTFIWTDGKTYQKPAAKPEAK